MQKCTCGCETFIETVAIKGVQKGVKIINGVLDYATAEPLDLKMDEIKVKSLTCSACGSLHNI